MAEPIISSGALAGSHRYVVGCVEQGINRKARDSVADSTEHITLLLERWQQGDEEALDELLPAVYDELRLIARRHLVKERADHSFQSTDLVDEAYLRLIEQNRVDWQGRAHFYGIAANFMRRILVDHARKRLAKKRPPQGRKVTLVPEITPGQDQDLAYLIDVDEAISKLAEVQPRQARVVELKFFVEMTNDEIATVLEVAPATVKRDWQRARSFLAERLGAHG